MKKINAFALFLIAASLLAACGQKESQSTTEASSPKNVEPVSAPTSGKYKIKSGVVSFETEAFGSKTKRVLYFDDFGSKERVEEYNEDGALREYRISDGKDRYNVMPDSKTAWLADHNGNLGWEMEFVGYERLKSEGYADNYEPLANVSIAGKDCESLKYSGSSTFAGWNGLTLLHEQEQMKTIATALEEKEVDGGLFSVPEGFEIKEFKR